MAIRDCHACPLRNMGCRFPVHGRGSGQARLAIVGEAPGADEDLAGRPFCGPAGRLLSDALAGSQVDESKLWVTNVYHCRPPKNDVKVANAQASICPRIWLTHELWALPNLKVIIALGRTALNFFRPGTENELVRDHARQDSRWRINNGLRMGPELMVVGSYHPSAALRGNEAAAKAIRDSIIRATAYLRREDWHFDEAD